MLKSKYFINKPKQGCRIKKYESKKQQKNPIRNVLAPETPSRLLLCGPSGCGKTNLLLNLIYDLLPWSRLYVYAKDLNEEKYCQLREACEKVQQIDEEFDFTFETNCKLNVDDLDPDEHNLIVFDDFVCDKTDSENISELFIRGRKKNATLIYLTQSYYDTPKVIRLQCNYFCFWNLKNDREQTEIHKDHSFGLTKKEFKDVFNEATSEPHSFLFLDTIHKNQSYRIRKNLNQPINVMAK